VPELPEVETIVRQLNQRLTGCQVKEFEVSDPKLLTPEVIERSKWLRKSTCTGARRIGKLAVISFDRPLHMGVHLRMTGRLLWSSAGDALSGRPARARVVFKNGQLLFQDTRRFGVIRLVEDCEDLLCHGIDPLVRGFSVEALAGLVGTSKMEIKPWLMRQDRLSGVGNIYASEILYASRIHPLRRACDLRPEEIERLHGSIKLVLKRAIRHCGVTFSDFQDSSGRIGSYQKYLAVYGRHGQTCGSCGSSIQRCVQQQRSTFFCPSCQT